jgi:hypothetical protein
MTRRDVLSLAAGAGILSRARLFGYSSDFWNKKDPGEWSPDEVSQLTTKSPWAKPVSAQYTPQGGGGGGFPGGGGYGGGGTGGGGTGRGGRQHGGVGMPTQSFSGTVRWESAKPVLEAMKKPLPEAFSDHYVISVSGFPLTRGRRGGTDDDSESRDSDTLDRLKGMTTLARKDGRDLQPGIVQQAPTAGFGTILFGFSKEMLSLKPDDKEVTFSTSFGRISIRTKFILKEMTYRGELAV